MLFPLLLCIFYNGRMNGSIVFFRNCSFCNEHYNAGVIFARLHPYPHLQIFPPSNFLLHEMLFHTPNLLYGNKTGRKWKFHFTTPLYSIIVRKLTNYEEEENVSNEIILIPDKLLSFSIPFLLTNEQTINLPFLSPSFISV